ncbi:unnamed protein product (macronuclear) [Paramecium tetraurelia]|uniref:Uncharacterized protein n=1 Tax=Paramecium tetraurelia TaxID=5888 RepID=A0E8Z2_PARTE|nr:uncharacterized protein GSPATT00024490001 [Paramecium tetraurelia]CAK91759.1 unnamed protein product [Paramecium tetraurelia]|eukprot:XP_001459156.1 hypothetical protein (macronuclear) [Paramecium tetraurelia strain d4-2]
MIALVTGAEAAWIGDVLIELVPLLANSITSLVRLSDTQQTQGINILLEQELELERGQFCKQILYNNEPINDIQLSEVMNETIIQIDRCCQSVWQYFPSGIATIFTWALTGQAMRHEFVIIDTTNHICCLELVKVQNEQQEQIQKLVFNIYGLETQEQRKIKRNQILAKRSYDRVLSSTKLNYQLYLSQINYFSNLLLISWRKIYQNKSRTANFFNLFQKMSKQYARSIYYFSLEQPDYDIVLQSIFGIFTDKPLFLPRLDMIAFEKMLWHGSKISDQMRSSINNFIRLVSSIRNGIDFSQTLVN